MDQRMTGNRSRTVKQRSSASERGYSGSAGLSALRKAPGPTRGCSPGSSGDSAESSISFAQQMRDFLHRNATWLLIAGLVLLFLQDVFGAHGVLAMRRSQKEARAVQKEIQQLNEANQRLQGRVQSLRTDPAAIERIAREEMGLARPGEYIFKLQPKRGEPSTPLAEPAQPAQSPLPQRHPKKR